MTQELISQLIEKSISVAVLAIGGYFIIRYFMQALERKDNQNQANLDRFIGLVENTNTMIGTLTTEIKSHGQKLQDISDDVRNSRTKTRS
jgi:hypothetical protein